MANKIAGIGQYNTVDPEFTAVAPSAETLRIAAMNAAPGQTAEEYLASRGGVNASGYYGDSWRATNNLTDAEYAATLKAAREAGATGVGLGDAINRATAKKRYDAAIAAGINPAKAKADYDAELAGTSGMLKGYGYQGATYGDTGKIVTSTKKNSDGSSTVTYSDGTSNIVPAGSTVPSTGTSAAQIERQSAYDTLYNEFNKYGLGSLVEDIKGLIQDAKTSPSQFAIALQNTDAYKKRFAANQDRIKAGLRALTPAEYIGLEDQYQNVMRNYGLPSSYYTKDSMGTQAGFNKFIANDVSASELEDRIATAQKRVINADVNVKDALRQFYPDITDGDILAYTLDPTNALENIKRKVTAAEIGGAALAQGLGTSAGRAEELAKYGITKAQAQQGYGQIGEFLPTGQKLSDIYAAQGLGDYSQAVAEAETFGTAGAAEAARKRKKLSELEKAQFSGSAGTSGNALNRDRAMTNQMLGTPGAGSF